VDELSNENRGPVVVGLAACTAASFAACLALAAGCVAEDSAFAVFPILSALSAGFSVGFGVVKGTRLRKIVGALRSVVVAIASGGLTLVLPLTVWVENCSTLY